MPFLSYCIVIHIGGLLAMIRLLVVYGYEACIFGSEVLQHPAQGCAMPRILEYSQSGILITIGILFFIGLLGFYDYYIGPNRVVSDQ